MTAARIAPETALPLIQNALRNLLAESETPQAFVRQWQLDALVGQVQDLANVVEQLAAREVAR